MNDNKVLIIADNLVNDYCGEHDRFTENNVHIGEGNVRRLFGRQSEPGALVSFLEKASKEDHCYLMFLRDCYTDDTTMDVEHLERLGDHCIKGSSGHEFIPNIEAIAARHISIECTGLHFPSVDFEQFLETEMDSSLTSNGMLDKIQVLIVGFHTERRILSIASALKNVYSFKNVAVFTHFVASSNVEAHFTALRYQFPDNLVNVINGVSRLSEYMGYDNGFLDEYGFAAVRIEPPDIREKLSREQRDIVESICMHWTEAKLKPLAGGFSGSALFIAHGKQRNSKTEPMVIKIDTHYPIRLEIKGYNQVKDFLGKHVPTFTLPVSVGAYSGIGMELAAMQGAPRTLQDHLESASNDYQLDAFLGLLDTTLDMLSERVYTNTLENGRIVPYRHFLLHISQQPIWLGDNINNIQRHESKDVFISSDVVVNLFNVVRKNNDALFTEMCVAHGDLNLANVIVDDKLNIWTIDWTHTKVHPVAVDFAKLENDIKFVLSKDLQMSDLPQVQQLEELLLSKVVPPPMAELPETLRFIHWDIRFKKIYLPVRAVRLAYFNLHQREDWLVYKVTLLRYALHTLSFDKTLDNGECNPCQLWHALASIENLLFQLVGEDYHLKIRSERPAHYPERQRINIDVASWKTECPDYEPTYFVTQSVLDTDRVQDNVGKADSEDMWESPDFIDWGRKYNRDETGKPLNPSGRTGLAGRGDLWFWGSNPMIFLCPIRMNKEANQLEMLVLTEGETTDIICFHLHREELLLHGLQRAFEKVNISSEGILQEEVHSGYIYDPRQTDNAWVDAKAYLIYVGESRAYPNPDFTYWTSLNDKFINELHPSYSGFVRRSVQWLFDQEILTDQFIEDILEKTG